MQQRQGDIYVVPVEALPNGLTKAKRDEIGRVVIALGESSGHAHTIRDKNVMSFVMETAERTANSAIVDYIEVAGSTNVHAQMQRRIDVLEATLSSLAQVLGDADLARDLREDAKAASERALAADPDAVPVKHEYESGKPAEHFPLVLAPGAHKAIQQRQYVAPNIESRVND